MLYNFDAKSPASATRVPIQSPAAFGIKEKDIELFFAAHLHELIPEDQLMLIGEERQRQEEADLFALDRKGTLYIFELKRWQGVRIDSLTYRVYSVEGKPHLWFDVYNPEQDVILEENPGIYCVNTNVTYMENAWNEMLTKKRASAYYDRKYAVAGIPKGSIIYLYHTGIRGRSRLCPRRHVGGNPRQGWKLEHSALHRAAGKWEHGDKS